MHITLKELLNVKLKKTNSSLRMDKVNWRMWSWVKGRSTLELLYFLLFFFFFPNKLILIQTPSAQFQVTILILHLGFAREEIK